MVTTVVFDLDGTLWDLRVDVSRILGLSCRQVASTPVPQLGRWHPGGLSGLAADLVADVTRGIAAILHEGVVETLDELRARGYGLAAATSLTGRLAVPVAEAAGLSTRLDAIITPGRGRRSKPAPDLLLAAARTSAGTPAVYVGDTPSDGKAAEAAGWPFYWASWGYGPTPSGPHTRLDHISELFDKIGGSGQ
jgi:AHBA synthesis associated protein